VFRYPQGRRPCGRLRHKWKDIPREIWCDTANWIHLLQYRAHWEDFMNALKNLIVSKVQGISWPVEQLSVFEEH